MTEVMVEPEAADAPPPRTHRRWLRLTAGLAIMVVVAAGLFGWRWLRNPDALATYPSYGESFPESVGHAVYSDTGIVPAVTPDGTGPTSTVLTIDAISAKILENTSHSVIRILVCTRNGGNLGIGTQDGNLSASCSRVSPFTGPETIDVGFQTAQIIISVTARNAGTLRIAGLDVSYRQGIRGTSQHTGADITVITR